MRRAVVAAVVVALSACGGPGGPRYEQLVLGPAADPPDAGPPPDPPPAVSYSTALGSLTGSEAFRVVSAQTILHALDGGAPSYVGFQVADVSQCLPAELDGGPGPVPENVSHILTGFVMSENGLPVPLGSHEIGMSPDGGFDTYLQLVEFDRDAGTDRMLLATSGTLALDSLDGGALRARIAVRLGDPTTQLELPLSGKFLSETCVGH